MRIISGKFKGKQYKGRIPKEIRPTQDSVKENIFNILFNYIDLDGVKMLDLFSGTGGVGFEAISRGAEYVVFIDKSNASCKYLEKAADILKIDKEQFQLLKGDAIMSLASIAKTNPDVKFDLIFADPPYQLNVANDLLEIIVKTDILAKDGIIILEVSSYIGIILPDNMEILSERVYGETKLVFIRKI